MSPDYPTIYMRIKRAFGSFPRGIIPALGLRIVCMQSAYSFARTEPQVPRCRERKANIYDLKDLATLCTPGDGDAQQIYSRREGPRERYGRLRPRGIGS